MTFNWKQAAGAIAFSAMALGATGGDMAEAKKGQKNDKIKDNGESVVNDPCKRPGVQCDPRQGGSSAERNKSDTIKPDPPLAATEKGIKDQGVKSCGSCGLTGREAAPPATGEGATPAPSVDIETGQMLDKGPRWPNKPQAAREAAPPATGEGATPPSAEKVETGQLLDKGPRWPNNKATERRAHSGPGGTPPSTAKNELCGLPHTPPCITNATAKKGSNTGLILGITAGAAALAAILASGNNNDNPTSP